MDSPLAVFAANDLYTCIDTLDIDINIHRSATSVRFFARVLLSVFLGLFDCPLALKSPY